MLLFLATAVVNTAVLYNSDVTKLDLWVNPINLGVILGGIFFGIGMSFSSCCASGVLTDLSTSLGRALVTLLFFGMGVFLGFPIQASQSWIKKSWFHSTTYDNGVYFPDWFKFDGLDGYLGASLLTGIIALVVIVISKKLNKSEENTITPEDEIKLKKEKYQFFSAQNYNSLFVNKWPMYVTGFIIIIVFMLMMGITKAGWGASTPFGFWFGKLLLVFGVPASSLAEFTMKPEGVYTMPFFSHPINMQNFGILLGGFIYLLYKGELFLSIKAGLKMRFQDVILYAVGGFLMGIGTRFANGCNVGALYTPIANFSLSGWVFFLGLLVGGVAANKFLKRIGKN